MSGVDVKKDVWKMLHLRFCVSSRSISEYCRKTFTVLSFGKCIFKYFDFLERSNLQTVTNEFLTDWNAIFMKKISKLYYSAIPSSTNSRLIVVLSWSYIYWDFIMCGTCSRKKRTNLLKRQTIQRLTKFIFITFFMHFLK